MRKLLEFLWSGCWHEWETESIINIVDSGPKVTLEDVAAGKVLPIGKKYLLRCKKCGDIKIVKTY